MEKLKFEKNVFWFRMLIKEIKWDLEKRNMMNIYLIGVEVLVYVSREVERIYSVILRIWFGDWRNRNGFDRGGRGKFLKKKMIELVLDKLSLRSKLEIKVFMFNR